MSTRRGDFFTAEDCERDTYRVADKAMGSRGADRPQWARRSQHGTGQFVEGQVEGAYFLITPGQARHLARELLAAAVDVDRSYEPRRWWMRKKVNL